MSLSKILFQVVSSAVCCFHNNILREDCLKKEPNGRPTSTRHKNPIVNAPGRLCYHRGLLGDGMTLNPKP